MGKVTFLNPEFLWLFLVLPLAIALLFYKRNQLYATLKMSSLELFKKNRNFSSQSLFRDDQLFVRILDT